MCNTQLKLEQTKPPLPDRANCEPSYTWQITEVFSVLSNQHQSFWDVASTARQHQGQWMIPLKLNLCNKKKLHQWKRIHVLDRLTGVDCTACSEYRYFHTSPLVISRASRTGVQNRHPVTGSQHCTDVTFKIHFMPFNYTAFYQLLDQQFPFISYQD